MFKCSVKVNQQMQKELNEKLWRYSIISVIVGALGILAYIIFGGADDSIWWDMFLWSFAFFFGFGIIMLFTVKKVNKNSVERNIVDEIELNETYLTETITKNGEVIATNKHYCKDFLKIRETENYLFLYVNKASAVPVLKSAFSPEELSTIKLWVNSEKIKK